LGVNGVGFLWPVVKKKRGPSSEGIWPGKKGKSGGFGGRWQKSNVAVHGIGKSHTTRKGLELSGGGWERGDSGHRTLTGGGKSIAMRRETVGSGIRKK